MQTRTDQFIHDFPATVLQSIIHYGAWRTNNQSLTSAITNQDNIDAPDEHYLAIGENTSGPTAFVDITFDANVKRILDVGGGRYDVNKHYLKRTLNIDLSIWDPFNRSASHNQKVYEAFTAEKADAVTSMSVLNVIPELTSRLAHIATVKYALKTGGKAYFKIWPGELPYKGSYTPTSTTESYQANAYADRFVREIELVFGKDNVTLDKKTANLIIAFKHSNNLTSVKDIETIQSFSKQDTDYILRFKTKALKKIGSEISLISSVLANLSLFKKHEYSNRYANERTQREHDKKFGLIKTATLTKKHY